PRAETPGTRTGCTTWISTTEAPTACSRTSTANASCGASGDERERAESSARFGRRSSSGSPAAKPRPAPAVVSKSCVEADIERTAVDVVHRRVRVDADVPVLRQLPEYARLAIEEIVRPEERVDPLREPVSDPDVVIHADAARVGVLRQRIAEQIAVLEAGLVAVLDLVDAAAPPVH